jgi:hypothetical protein
LEYTFKITITRERYYSEDSHWGIFQFYTTDMNEDIPLLDKSFYGDKREGEIIGEIQRLELGRE